MVIEQGYTWTRVPGTDVEIRVLGNRPVALRYRKSLHQTVTIWVLSPQTDRTRWNGHEYH